MKAAGLVTDDGGALAWRAVLSVSNLDLTANDAWLLSFLHCINDQPESEQVIAAKAAGRSLRAHEGRLDLHPSALRSMRGVVAAWSSPTRVQASTAGPLDVMSIPNLAGCFAPAIDDVLDTRGRAAWRAAVCDSTRKAACIAA